MSAQPKLRYRVFEGRPAGRQWRWEVFGSDGQIIDSGTARSTMEARAEAVRRGLASTSGARSPSSHKSEGESGAAPSA
jgi:hypothetical protein